MQTPDQLFAYKLNEMLAAEQELAAGLDHLCRESTNQQLQHIFSAHLAETQNHVARVQQALSSIGQQPIPTTCEGVSGIISEHERFVGQQTPSPQVHTVFDVGAGEKIEHYEIAAYEELVRQANALGSTQVAQLLEANLADERRQLTRLRNAATNIDLSQLSARTQGPQSVQSQSPQPQLSQPQPPNPS